MIRVVLLAPIDNSLYARLVSFRIRQESDVELAGIVVRSPWNLGRFLSEFNRDGQRLLRKVLEKGFRGDRRFEDYKGDTLAKLAERWDLPFKSLKNLAAEFNIPYKVVSDHNQPESERFIHQIAPDLIVFTGGGLISENILTIPTIGIMNCHTGILPQYRGMDVVEWTAAEGNIENVGFGVTLHLMDKGVDTGPIIEENRIAPDNLKGFPQIRAELEVKMVELMVKGVKGFTDGSNVIKQQHKEDGRQYFVMHPRMESFARLQLLKQIKNS